MSIFFDNEGNFGQWIEHESCCSAENAVPDNVNKRVNDQRSCGCLWVSWEYEEQQIYDGGKDDKKEPRAWWGLFLFVFFIFVFTF